MPCRDRTTLVDPLAMFLFLGLLRWFPGVVAKVPSFQRSPRQNLFMPNE